MSSEPLLPIHKRSTPRSSSPSVFRRGSKNGPQSHLIAPDLPDVDADRCHSDPDTARSPPRRAKWRNRSPFGPTSPLLRRRGRHKQPALHTPFGSNAVGEAFSFPHVPDCAHCGLQLNIRESHWRTGLCDTCYIHCPKVCMVCQSSLPLQQLQFGSGLCKACFHECEKQCRLCSASLVFAEHWHTGLCDVCYVSCEKRCKMCDSKLDRGQLHWGTGLCNACYSSCKKNCKICKVRLHDRWGTGLCDNCYGKCSKTCVKCNQGISLGSLHWSTGLCDNCYDGCSRSCKQCRASLDIDQVHLVTGLCNACYDNCGKTCIMCSSGIDSGQLWWGTGLCDSCYNRCEKQCHLCATKIPFGQLHWNSGLCDACYENANKACMSCESDLPLGQVHWGTNLCDACFDKCEKTCRECQVGLDLGQRQWGTGLCDRCYDAKKTPAYAGFSKAIRATIGAQFTFYMAPAILQPSLFIEMQRYGYGKATPSVYAAVLTTASLMGMIAPVLLGIWAHRRGEREVYCGITLAGAVAAAVFAFSPPATVFCLAWALLTGPPAVRGVRAVFYAKHVEPAELSRAGQLASSAGLLGGFVGPALSAVMTHVAGDGSDGAWPDGFTVSAALACLALVGCVLSLWKALPRTVRRARSRRSSSSAVARCQCCKEKLSEAEQKYATALCDACYNDYGGVNYNQKSYSRDVLISCCVIAGLLEFSMNAAILATFQPLVVTHFNWGNGAIAAVNVASTGLSVVISFALVRLRLSERVQTAAAVALYVVGVLVFTAPPLAEWRIIVGLMLGIKAQILFMAPFTAIFSRLIGPERITNFETTILCLAPAVGAMLGTLVAPVCISFADTPFFMLAGLPAAVAVVGTTMGWHHALGPPVLRRQESAEPASSSVESP